MSTAVSDLNILKALRNSLPFCAQFIKQHWIVFTFYVLASFVVAVLFKDQNWNITKIVAMLFSLVLLESMDYYVVRMATLELSPSMYTSNKSFGKTLWQLLCLIVLICVVECPLSVLLLIPGIWWLTKTCVAFVNIVNTDASVLDSIKMSFQLTKGKFWQCLGFLVGTMALPALAVLIVAIPVSFCLQIMGLLHDWSMPSIISLAEVIPTAIAGIIGWFCQTWLYIYLKDNNQSSVPSQ